MTDPYFNTIPPMWYAPTGICCDGPTGIEVYTGTQIAQWRNDLFMASFNQGALFHFTLNEERTLVTSTRLVGGVKAQMDVLTGPDGALYYIEGGGYSEGSIKRIVGPGDGEPLPSAIATSLPNTPTPPTPMPSPTPIIPGDGSRTFTETGKTVTGIFLDYWNNNGGLAQQGFPISSLMTEVSDLDGKSYTVQYFERAVFEYHPENPPPYNVLLSQLGTFSYTEKYPGGAPNQTPNAAEGSLLFQETGKRIGGKFLDYWRRNGSLAQNGYPISDEFEERSDLNGQTYTVQYFERAAFEYHPENQPPSEVLLSQLGTFRYRQKYGDR